MISLIFQKYQYYISFKGPAARAQQELSLDGLPLQSLSVDRGQAGAILIDIDDDGDDDDD